MVQVVYQVTSIRRWTFSDVGIVATVEEHVTNGEHGSVVVGVRANLRGLPRAQKIEAWLVERKPTTSRGTARDYWYSFASLEQLGAADWKAELTELAGGRRHTNKRR